MERNDVVKLAVDLTRGHVEGNFSKGESTEVLRQALIAANGGSYKLDRKALRRNKVEIFEILEEIIPAIREEGFRGDEFFNRLVDQRNIGNGDEAVFTVDDPCYLIVTEIADGIAYPRRQRLAGKQSVTVTTSVHAVRVYEEFSRFMAGRIDWNDLIAKVAQAFAQKIYSDIYTALNGVTSSTLGLNSTYVTGGTYDEANLLALVEHVEAATNKPAMIFGTKAALRKVTTAVMADQAKQDYYEQGYYGRVAGIPMVAVRQNHTPGTDTFAVTDDKLWVVASDDKPFKLVFAGDAWIDDKTDGTQADKTIEYTYEESFGIGVIFNGKMGVFALA